VEVADLPIVEDVACGWFIEGVLVVQDLLLKGADMSLYRFMETAVSVSWLAMVWRSPLVIP